MTAGDGGDYTFNVLISLTLVGLWRELFGCLSNDLAQVGEFHLSIDNGGVEAGMA